MVTDLPAGLAGGPGFLPTGMGNQVLHLLSSQCGQLGCPLAKPPWALLDLRAASSLRSDRNTVVKMGNGRGPWAPTRPAVSTCPA